ncbi:molecular chaperone HtpG [Acholeplasma vituli]|uniref:Chaperone protein HtpG n=1 Tax=Paracholeplasma vituli TaxID=69473 RepID=A0ABT2PZ12_9MOLU|nr:molecular chaperone HtpG [Paracholeplasma vituli]MCU0105721.1 molecular chaperone HtpG [Paracholeplasma vituli]
MSKTQAFKTESQKLLHLMTHSIYTQKEIFLRELISNASDAIDKRHFLSLTDEKVPSDTYQIKITADKEKRTLTITDNGIGFTEEELIQNLGTIAQSGSKAFIEKLDQNDTNIIGQFGVGFYSAFMVSDKVEVRTRSPFSPEGFIWSSDGVSEFTVDLFEKDSIGTEITLYLKEDIEDEEGNESFSEYLETYELRSLIKKYSDYVRYPIYLSEDLEKPVNQMTPLWQRSKADITEEALNGFYKHQFNDFEDPMKVIHMSVEGMLTFNSLLFIPKKPAYNFYSETYEKGLQLYSKGVFIQDKNKDLIGDHFKFVKGVVDSSDLSLNISRELLQQDRQLKKIASSIEKKIKSELQNWLENDRDKYIEFYDTYKTSLKYGIYQNFGLHKELLQDLILFKTNLSDDYISFKEYLDRKKTDQKDIYYATGKSKQAILNLPQMGILKEKGFEVLLLTEEVDEFMIQVMGTYNEVPFKSIQSADLDLVDEDKKKDIEKKSESNKSLLEAMKEALGDKVKEVRLSKRLKDAPVCLVSGEGLSLEMEKVLKNVPNADQVKAERILELNPDHEIFQVLQSKVDDKDALKSYATLLYHQALLIEGLPIEDPTEYIQVLNDWMVHQK